MKAYKILPNGRMVFPEPLGQGKTGRGRQPDSTLILSSDFTDAGWDKGLVPPEIEDSYSESNHAGSVFSFSSTLTKVGQSFTANVTGNLVQAKFYLRRNGIPTGTIQAAIYEHTGSYGAGGTGTGSALAISDPLIPTSFSTTIQLITFNFSGVNAIQLISGTRYVAVVEYVNASGGNTVLGGVDISSPTHSGNFVQFNSSVWSGNALFDTIFYVYYQPTNILYSRDFGGVNGTAYRVSLTLSGTAGTVTAQLGNGTNQICNAGTTTTFIGTHGNGYITLTGSTDFNGLPTSIIINTV